MSTETQRRPYTKKRRAELEAETRQRITESAVELHGTLGPSRTTISAIGRARRRAALDRLPPLPRRGFALLRPAPAHWMAQNPLPDLGDWAAIEDPDERLATALGEMYARYRRTERMMDNLLRDETTMPIVQELFGGYHGYIAAARDVLMAGRRDRGKARAARAGRDRPRARIRHLELARPRAGPR